MRRLVQNSNSSLSRVCWNQIYCYMLSVATSTHTQLITYSYNVIHELIYGAPIQYSYCNIASYTISS